MPGVDALRDTQDHSSRETTITDAPHDGLTTIVPNTEPQSTLRLGQDGSVHEVASVPQNQAYFSSGSVEEDLTTPRPETPVLIGTRSSQDVAVAGKDTTPSITTQPFPPSSSSSNDGYFESEPPSYNLPRPTESFGSTGQVPSLGQDSAKFQHHATSLDSPGQPPSTWQDPNLHSHRPHTGDSAMIRPTSVPNFPSNPLTTQQIENNYGPQYPDQTFQALQSPQHPPPPPSRMPRTRSSHSSGFTHTLSTSNDRSTKDITRYHFGSRTVGNTPAQSPGLCSPSFPSKKKAPDSDDGRPTSHVLHIAHLQEPKEYICPLRS